MRNLSEAQYGRVRPAWHADQFLHTARAQAPYRRTTGRIAAAAALMAALGTGLVACGSGSDLAPDVSVENTATVPAEQGAPSMPKSRPTGLRIPSAKVDAKSMLDLSVDKNKELQVPPADKADEPGWWTGSVTPGEKGAAVLVAHYDTANGPALMRNVANVDIGATIEVPRADGSTAKFQVREIQQVSKEHFPTDKVYGSTDHPELRLLTCGGPIKNGHRTDNIIFYADLMR